MVCLLNGKGDVDRVFGRGLVVRLRQRETASILFRREGSKIRRGGGGGGVGGEEEGRGGERRMK